MPDTFVLQLLTGAAIGLGAGFIGSLMVLRRMSLVGDALSHVALPGIAVGILFGFDPFIGAFATLALSVLGIWWLSRRTVLPSETLVGIFFTLALAAGLLLTPEPELLEALFGDITQVNLVSAIVSVCAVVVTVLTVYRVRPVLILDTISPELARTSGRSVARAEFFFLFLVAVIVALGLRVAGTLLTGALVIIPAAAARNMSPSLSQYSLLSALFGGFAATAGILASVSFGVHPGPLVILTGGILFVISLFFRR